jgi:hypothetical protein
MKRTTSLNYLKTKSKLNKKSKDTRRRVANQLNFELQKYKLNIKRGLETDRQTSPIKNMATKLRVRYNSTHLIRSKTANTNNNSH